MRRRIKIAWALSVALTTTCFIAAAGSASAPRSGVAKGQKAPAFQTRTVDGKTVSFSADYKGKLVLLDFWATWCPPCRAELPNVVAAYNQYHDKGFEIVSVSLDEPREGPALLKFFKENNMSWPQIYDGHGWKGSVPTEYGVHAIPAPVLVDGDTGMIVATDGAALGHNLTKRLDVALAAKTRK